MVVKAWLAKGSDWETSASLAGGRVLQSSSRGGGFVLPPSGEGSFCCCWWGGRVLRFLLLRTVVEAIALLHALCGKAYMSKASQNT